MGSGAKSRSVANPIAGVDLDGPGCGDPEGERGERSENRKREQTAKRRPTNLKQIEAQAIYTAK